MSDLDELASAAKNHIRHVSVRRASTEEFSSPRKSPWRSPFVIGFGLTMGVLCAAFVFYFCVGFVQGLGNSLTNRPEHSSPAAIESAVAMPVIPALPPLPARPDARVSARELIDRYVQNEIAASRDFEGRYVEVDGVIEIISRDLLNDAYITLGTGRPADFRSVQCMFEENATEPLRELRKGQRVKIRGFVGGLMMNLVVRRCTFHDVVPSLATDVRVTGRVRVADGRFSLIVFNDSPKAVLDLKIRVADADYADRWATVTIARIPAHKSKDADVAPPYLRDDDRIPRVLTQVVSGRFEEDQEK